MGPWFAFAAADNHVSVATAIYKPFIFLEEDGRLDGIYHEYFVELAKKAGLEAHFEAMPIPRVLNHAARGTYDFFMFVSGAPEIKQNYVEVARLQKLQMVLISLAKDINMNSKVINIGKPVGTMCPAFSDEDEKKIKYFEYESFDQAMKMMTSHRLDALCTSRERFHFELRNSSFANTKYFEIPKYRHELIISLFAHKRLQAQKIASVAKAALELEQKKFMSTLYKKYGLNEEFLR